MTGGWWALLVVLVVAELAALAARQRALTRRRWAEEEAADEAFLAAIANPVWFTGAEALGMHVGVSRHIPPGQVIIGQLPPLPPLRLEGGWLRADPMEDLRRYRMMQEFRLGWDVADRSRTAPIIITGI